MKEAQSSVDIQSSAVQVLPNAQYAIQNFYGIEPHEHKLQSNMCSGESIPEGAVVNMYYYSESCPDAVKHEIVRQAILDFIERRLEENNILCLFGEEGVGVTTILSQFVRAHATHCVSYFYDGLSIIRLHPEVMAQNIVQQLYWYVFGGNEHFNINDAEKYDLPSLWTHVSRKVRNENRPLYFAFDGFDDLPMEKKESVKHLLANMDWSRGKFIFTGRKKQIKDLLPTGNKLSISEYEIIPFEQADIREYFRKAQNNLSDEELDSLCEITRGNGHRMEIVLQRYIEKNRLQDLLQSDVTGESDLYDEDFHLLFAESDPLTENLFALLTYADFPLHKSIAAAILDISIEEFEKMTVDYRDFVSASPDGYCKLSQPGFHKYLKKKLKNLKQKTELRILHELQKHKNETSYTRVIPALMKSLGQTENLVSFLNNENMQQILVTGKSQAALNEQCEFGYNACKASIDRYASALFRFAVNRSMSREIEKNELWDYELEALLATGHIEQALALAQNVYLSEERLKSFLIIARRKNMLRSNDYDIVKENIDQLVSIIEFEKIPDKAIELAKLLIPIDYQAAICIVDRVTKANRETVNADKVYSMMSLMANKPDDEMGNVNKADLLSSKIENDELRTFTHAAKNLFADVSVDRFLMELDKLPSDSRKLHFLQIWLPEHSDKEGIGKAILEAVKLIVAVSGTDMPKAKILNRVCQSMSKMDADDMSKAMLYIESMAESIKYPTFDYVDAELTIIEAIKDVLPEKSKEHLENIYLHIHDLTDNSVKAACLSKLLGKFDDLGPKSETEKILGCSSVEIRRDITQLIHQLLSETAYHLKVIEEPIKALVCNYPTMIDELITEINTVERKKRAYSQAASYYLLKQKEDEINPSYFFELISKTDNTYDNRENPLELLSWMLLYADKANHAAFLPVVIREFHYFEELEGASPKVIIFMRLYLWMKKHFPDENFAEKIKHGIWKNWKLLDTLKAQIECGFFLAKNFAKTSKEDAETILNECGKLKEECLLGSSSCVSAYDIAMKLYIRSMALLVRYGLCREDVQMLSEFREDIDSQLSTIEKATIWSSVALEYYLANDHQQFEALCMEYIPSNLDNLSVMSRKCILFRVAPALFIHNRDTFYTVLKSYDETFRNDCLKHVAEFVICKQAFLSGTSMEQKAYDLNYKDYQDLIAVLEHSTEDDVFHQVILIVSKSLREGRPKQMLSTEQKNTIVNQLEQIVRDKLPSVTGIQHDGYKIACQAALRYVNGDFGSDQKAHWKTEIAKIGNIADRAFLFLQIAPYFKKRQDKEDFFQRGIDLANSLSSTYDKVSRLDMSISECMENNLSNMVKPVAESALGSLRINGSLEDHQRLIDMVYQHKPELAEEMVNNMDRDPARVQYKQRLLNRITSAKKLKQAHDNLDSDDSVRIDQLSLVEQIKFFDKQLDDLINGKGQLLNVEKIFNIAIKHIYANNIENAQWAILYVLEDIFKKYKDSKENRELLLNMHSALRFNLKLALSLGAGTKERIYRVDSLIRNHSYTDDGYLQIGDEEKAMAYIVNWYQSVRYNTLTIIDPYFKPKDLGAIKTLCDINNDLEIRILTHRGKYCNEDYSYRWHTISSGVTNIIKLNFVWYEDKPEDGPMHDRYWICSDEDNDTHNAIMLCSVDTLGKKESSITSADENITMAALHSYMRYAHTRIKTVKGRILRYDSMELD